MIKRLLLFLWIKSALSFGAACCGSNATSPGILAGDDERQLTARFALGGVAGERDTQAQYLDRGTGDSENRESFQIEYSTLVSDRFQVAARLPFLRKERFVGNLHSQSSGLGDPSLALSYEWLPEWNYSSWKPKGFIYLGWVVPLGTSRFNSTELFAVDSRGKGFWTPSMGVFFVKRWNPWDLSVLGELRKPLGRDFKNASGQEAFYAPGWEHTLQLDGGFSFSQWRLGAGISRSYEESLHIEGSTPFVAPPVELWEASLSLSYLISPTMTLAFNYQRSKHFTFFL